MFNKNFYPTPDSAISILTQNVEPLRSKILEPSAGKGNIVDFLAKKETWNSNKVDIDVLEIEPELQQILYSKKCNVVGSDFLTYETHTEYDYIIMNPPFDNGAKHLIKAIQLAEKQSTLSCEIRCILNSETVLNPYSDERKYLMRLIDKHSGSYTIHDELFKDAERSTNVQTAIITIKVLSKSNNYKTIFDSIVNKMETQPIQQNALSTILKSHEIEKREKDIYLYVDLYNEHVTQIKNIYSSVASLFMYEKDAGSIVQDKSEKDYFNFYTGIDKHKFDNLSETIETVRKTYWKLILNSDEFEQKLTNDARDELQKMLDSSSSIEITIDNIKMLLNALYQNKGEMLKQATLNMFEKLTENHMGDFAKNIHYYNGWKTNNAFKVGKKVIIRDYSYGKHSSFNEWKGKWDDDYNSATFSDLIKALSPLTTESLNQELTHDENGKYENDKFIIKCYLKGTTHITFKDQDLLDRFNIICGQESGMLPTDYEVKNDNKAREFMFNEFKNYEQIKISFTQ